MVIKKSFLTIVYLKCTYIIKNIILKSPIKLFNNYNDIKYYI